jgi:antitoxin HigA-1
MSKIKQIHPGEILKEEFLKPLNITMYRLAKDINVPAIRISEIVKNKRAITADTALRLAKYFNNSPEFWLNLQLHYNLEKERRVLSPILKNKVKKFKLAT